MKMGLEIGRGADMTDVLEEYLNEKGLEGTEILWKLRKLQGELCRKLPKKIEIDIKDVSGVEAWPDLIPPINMTIYRNTRVLLQVECSFSMSNEKSSTSTNENIEINLDKKFRNVALGGSEDRFGDIYDEIMEFLTKQLPERIGRQMQEKARER